MNKNTHKKYLPACADGSQAPLTSLRPFQLEDGEVSMPQCPARLLF